MFLEFRVGIKRPKIEVRFENVSVEGDVSVGSKSIPTLFNSTLHTIEVFYLFVYSEPLTKAWLILITRENIFHFSFYCIKLRIIK